MNAPAGVLTARAAPVALEDALALVRENWSLEATGRLLTGERDQNFEIVAPDGHYLLKLSSPAEDPAVVDFESGALLHLARADPALPVQRVLATRAGRHAATLAAPGQPPRIARLLTFLPGRLLHQVEPDEALLRDIGGTLARLARALAGYRHAASRRELAWDLRHLPGLRGLVGCVGGAAMRELVTAALDTFESRVMPRLAGLPQQVVHNDFNPHNLVVGLQDPPRLAGVIDFGDMVHTARVFDLAIAASYHVRAAGDDPLGGAATLVAAYDAVLPLATGEREVLADAIRGRLACSVLITEWRAGLFPENRAYILRNNARARAGLEALARMGRERTAARLGAAFARESPA